MAGMLRGERPGLGAFLFLFLLSFIWQERSSADNKRELGSRRRFLSLLRGSGLTDSAPLFFLSSLSPFLFFITTATIT